MKRIQSKLRLLALAAGSLAITALSANAAADTAYNANDLLLFFQNPTGSVGNSDLVLYSLGSTYDVFRRAATPGDATFGTTISLGNINSILTTAYGSDWTGLSSTIFAGAAGQNGATSGISTAISNGDYARTVYVTKPRSGAGTAGSADSATAAVSPAGSSGVSAAISGANAVLNGQLSLQVANSGTTIDTNNPFSPTPTTPGTAYTGISGGVQGALGSSYTLGSISNVVLGLDLYRVTPVITGATAWQNANSISGVTAGQGYFLGTVTVSSNGDVNFAAVPEPSTYALLALSGVVVFIAARRRKVQA